VSYRSVIADMMPTGLRDPVGQAWVRAHGIVLDYLAERARASVRQRLPTYAASDALGMVGTERGIDLGESLQRSPAESLADYRARVRQARVLWHFGGSPIGMLVAFAVQGYYPQLVCANGDVFSVAPGAFGAGTWAAGDWVDPADVVAELVISSTAPAADLLWNTFYVWFPTMPSSWTSPAMPATTTSVPNIYELRRLWDICVRRWKPGWARCLFIGVSTDSPGIWGAPGISWDDPGLVWGAGSTYLFYETD